MIDQCIGALPHASISLADIVELTKRSIPPYKTREEQKRVKGSKEKCSLFGYMDNTALLVPGTIQLPLSIRLRSWIAARSLAPSKTKLSCREIKEASCQSSQSTSMMVQLVWWYSTSWVFSADPMNVRLIRGANVRGCCPANAACWYPRCNQFSCKWLPS